MKDERVERVGDLWERWGQWGRQPSGGRMRGLGRQQGAEWGGERLERQWGGAWNVERSVFV